MKRSFEEEDDRGGVQDGRETPDDSWFDERIEAFVDGELSPDERRAVQDRRVDPEFAAQLAVAKRLRTELAGLRAPSCPDEVTADVLAWAREARVASHGRSWRHLLVDRARRSLRPVGLVAAVAGLVGIGYIVRQSEPEVNSVNSSATYAEDEVTQALREAKWAISYVSDMGRHTGRPVRQQVRRQVVGPVSRAVGYLFVEDARAATIDTDAEADIIEESKNE